MANDANAQKAPKTGWFEGLKAEFGKIVWPAKEQLAKQTAAVIAVSVAVGLVITILDTFIQYGIDFLVNL
ncbi:MAG: preprotein translocase subunit SecE [Eubacterium sp.]|jgi:preprotein translocase subunit SecE|nr:preprotein translocase subunit SecE [Eubacterium sp.]